MLNLSAANFWEWGHTRLYLPGLWDTIADYPWSGDPQQQDIVESYFAALNLHSATQVLTLYHQDAAHVTNKRSIQGHSALSAWYDELFSQLLPNAAFSLIESSGSLGSRYFKWTAESTAGNVRDGDDSFGVVGGKIVYHYTSFTIAQA